MSCGADTLAMRICGSLRRDVADDATATATGSGIVGLSVGRSRSQLCSRSVS